MIRRYLPILSLSLLLTGCVPWNSSKPDVHYHAGFRLYVQNSPVDFSLPQYMTFKPCSENEDHAKVDEQLEKAHLHDMVGDIVHVHRPEATWGDLFNNLKYSFPANTPLRAYTKTGEVSNPLSQRINPNDSLIFVLGEAANLDKILSQIVTLDRIRDIGSRGESCTASNL